MFRCVLLLLDNKNVQMSFALARKHTFLDVFCSCWITNMFRCLLLLLDNIHVYMFCYCWITYMLRCVFLLLDTIHV